MRNTLIDAGPIIALFDRSDRYHRLVTEFLQVEEFKLTTTWPVVTEASHLLDFSLRAQLALLEWIQRGGLAVYEIDIDGVRRAMALMEKYHDRPMDLADATLVVAAEKTGIREIVSIDSDFLVYRTENNQLIENVLQS